MNNDNLIISKNNLYIRKENQQLLPIAHPDISTQPSVMPYRFGKLKIMEVLIPTSSSSEITDKGVINVHNVYAAIQEGEFIYHGSTILSISLFTADKLIQPHKVEKEGDVWKIYMDMNEFDDMKYCLVKYYYIHN